MVNYCPFKDFSLLDEYNNPFTGCQKAMPPPSEENELCKSFHKQINDLKTQQSLQNNQNSLKIDETFVTQFLNSTTHAIAPPAEALLFPTNEIRYKTSSTKDKPV